MPIEIAKPKKRTRIYLVARRDNGTERLVKASQRNAALSHVAVAEYDVRKATEDDLERLLPTQQLEVARSKAVVSA